MEANAHEARLCALFYGIYMLPHNLGAMVRLGNEEFVGRRLHLLWKLFLLPDPTGLVFQDDSDLIALQSPGRNEEI